MQCPLVPTLASCPQGDYLSEKGICCNKCPPGIEHLYTNHRQVPCVPLLLDVWTRFMWWNCLSGFKLHQDCQAAGQRTSCTVCPDRQYTDQMNFAPNCKSCIRCKGTVALTLSEFVWTLCIVHVFPCNCPTESDNKEEVSQCEINQNTVCRCKYGYYKYKIDSETFECLKCKKCGPEETETQTCTSVISVTLIYASVNNVWPFACSPPNICAVHRHIGEEHSVCVQGELLQRQRQVWTVQHVSKAPRLALSERLVPIPLFRIVLFKAADEEVGLLNWNLQDKEDRQKMFWHFKSNVIRASLLNVCKWLVGSFVTQCIVCWVYWYIYILKNPCGFAVYVCTSFIHSSQTVSSKSNRH